MSILKQAEQAGFFPNLIYNAEKRFLAFAAIVTNNAINEEREACASLCESLGNTQAAEAIRAR